VSLTGEWGGGLGGTLEMGRSGAYVHIRVCVFAMKTAGAARGRVKSPLSYSSMAFRPIILLPDGASAGGRVNADKRRPFKKHRSLVLV